MHGYIGIDLDGKMRLCEKVYLEGNRQDITKSRVP